MCLHARSSNDMHQQETLSCTQGVWADRASAIEAFAKAETLLPINRHRRLKQISTLPLRLEPVTCCVCNPLTTNGLYQGLCAPLECMGRQLSLTGFQVGYSVFSSRGCHRGRAASQQVAQTSYRCCTASLGILKQYSDQCMALLAGYHQDSAT